MFGAVLPVSPEGGSQPVRSLQQKAVESSESSGDAQCSFRKRRLSNQTQINPNQNNPNQTQITVAVFQSRVAHNRRAIACVACEQRCTSTQGNAVLSSTRPCCRCRRSRINSVLRIRRARHSICSFSVLHHDNLLRPWLAVDAARVESSLLLSSNVKTPCCNPSLVYWLQTENHRLWLAADADMAGYPNEQPLASIDRSARENFQNIPFTAVHDATRCNTGDAQSASCCADVVRQHNEHPLASIDKSAPPWFLCFFPT